MRSDSVQHENKLLVAQMNKFDTFSKKPSHGAETHLEQREGTRKAPKC